MERVVKIELSKLNVPLPQQRISLRDALNSDKPQILMRDGNTHVFKREELEMIKKILLEDEQAELQLPIFIMLNPSFGRGTAKISGRVETKVACYVLGKEKTREELIVYRPEIASLRRKFPTTTQYLFIWGPR